MKNKITIEWDTEKDKATYQLKRPCKYIEIFDALMSVLHNIIHLMKEKK